MKIGKISRGILLKCCGHHNAYTGAVALASEAIQRYGIEPLRPTAAPQAGPKSPFHAARCRDSHVRFQDCERAAAIAVVVSARVSGLRTAGRGGERRGLIRL